MHSHLLVACFLTIQSSAPPPRLEGEALERAVDELAKLISDNYVFADVGAQVAEHLHARLIEGAYETTDLETLAARLGADLRSVNGDRHLRVSVVPARSPSEPSADELRRREREEERQSNHGFARLEILQGNVGYLDLRGLDDAGSEEARTPAAQTAIAVMRFFANADALVIDLRQNHGGTPSMTQLLCSYFFAEPTLLNTFEWRGQAEREELWTFAEVAGERLADVPLYVLTSPVTFSGAEGFAYHLQAQKRATVVGARTGGGAHPGSTHSFGGGALAVFVPNGRAINPITESNWEGKGVQPDVEVVAEQALDVALARAREELRTRRAAPGAR